MTKTVKKMLSLFRPDAKPNAIKPPGRKILNTMSKGTVPCATCGTQYDVAERRPLSMFNCGACGDLVFVPWHIDGIWVFEPIAAGGYGSIYHGLETESGRGLAVKVLRDYANVDDIVRACFLKECEAAYALGSHPNIAMTHSYGSTDDAAYMAMQYVPGERLSDIVEERSTLPAQLVLGYLRDLVQGLAYMEVMGYVHRDVKPENVIVTPEGSAVLIDYGSCMTLEEAAAIDGGPIFGSPHFCPPERYEGRPEDIRSDIYALGHIAYFCLTGKYYAKGDGIAAVKRAHTSRMRVSLSARLQKHDGAVVDLIGSMVKWDIERRCDSYDALYKRISALLNR